MALAHTPTDDLSRLMDVADAIQKKTATKEIKPLMDSLRIMRKPEYHAVDPYWAPEYLDKLMLFRNAAGQNHTMQMIEWALQNHPKTEGFFEQPQGNIPAQIQKIQMRYRDSMYVEPPEGVLLSSIAGGQFRSGMLLKKIIEDMDFCEALLRVFAEKPDPDALGSVVVNMDSYRVALGKWCNPACVDITLDDPTGYAKDEVERVACLPTEQLSRLHIRPLVRALLIPNDGEGGQIKDRLRKETAAALCACFCKKREKDPKPEELHHAFAPLVAARMQFDFVQHFVHEPRVCDLEQYPTT